MPLPSASHPSLQTRHGRRLIGASFHQGMVGLWSVDLSTLGPFRNQPQAPSASREVAHSREAPMGARPGAPATASAAAPLSVRGSHPSSSSEAAQTAAHNGERERRNSASAALSAAAPPEVARRPHSGGTAAASAAAAAAAAASASAATSAAAAAANARRGVVGESVSAGRPPLHVGVGRYSSGPASEEWGSPDEGPSSSHRHHLPPQAPTNGVRPLSGGHAAASGPSAPPASAPPAKPMMVSMGVGVGDSLLKGQVPQGPLNLLPGVQAALGAAHIQPPGIGGRRPGSGGSMGEPSGGHAYSKWRDGDIVVVPASAPSARGMAVGISGVGGGGGGGDSGAAAGGSGRYDAQSVSEIMSRASEMRADMTSRVNTLQLAKGFLARSDTRGAVRHLARCQEPAAAADVLCVMLERRDAFALDDVPELCRIVSGILSLPAERQVKVGLQVVALLLTCFGSVIRDAAAAAARPNGVDLASEQRAARSAAARLAMQGVAAPVSLAGRMHDALRVQATEAAAQLGTL